MKSRFRSLGAARLMLSSLLVCCLASFALADEAPTGGILVQPGQKVAFLGDSITSAGWDSPAGYVRLVVSAFKTNGIEIKPIPAGVSGNTSNDMLRRLDRDVIAKKPDWLTISCGVNDVWHNPGGVPLDQYKVNITKIVDQAQAAGIKVVILTATMIGEDQHNANNQKLIPYNDFLRQFAKERKLPLADLAAQMQAEIASETAAGWTPGHLLTVDGVHMNPRGNVVMATGILKAVGFTDEQIAKAHEIWLDIPDGWSAKLTIPITVTKSLTLRQYDALQKTAPRNSAGGVYELLQQLYHDDFLAVLSPGDKDGLEKLKKQLQEKIDQDIDQRLKQ